MDHANILIYDIAQNIFNKLGPGHSEFIYHRAMEVELRSNHIQYESEKRVIITYTDSNKIEYSLGEERIDIYLINDKIIIELKAMINPPKETEVAQLNKYYRELRKKNIDISYGIIINFPQAGIKEAKTYIDFIEIKYNNI